MSLLKHWRHLLFALVALAAVTAFAAACGGDDDEKKATASPAAGSPTAAEKLAFCRFPGSFNRALGFTPAICFSDRAIV